MRKRYFSFLLKLLTLSNYFDYIPIESEQSEEINMKKHPSHGNEYSWATVLYMCAMGSRAREPCIQDLASICTRFSEHVRYL